METQKSKNGIYPSGFYNYIRLVEDEDLKTVLQSQVPEIINFLRSVDEEKSYSKYAEGKWSIKEVLQHIIDSERVFDYRALAFSRNDKNALPSFDEKNYADNSNADSRKWNELIEEFSAVRKSTQYLFNSFSPEQLDAVGTANNCQMSVKALGYTIAGHVAHHINVIKERYLID